MLCKLCSSRVFGSFLFLIATDLTFYLKSAAAASGNVLKRFPFFLVIYDRRGWGN